MNTLNYIEVVFDDLKNGQEDMLIALLGNYGFEGFEEEDQKLKAYIGENNFNEQEFAEIIQPYELNYNVRTIPSQNWNAVWEEHFDPVMVLDFVGIRAH